MLMLKQSDLLILMWMQLNYLNYLMLMLMQLNYLMFQPRDVQSCSKSHLATKDGYLPFRRRVSIPSSGHLDCLDHHDRLSSFLQSSSTSSRFSQVNIVSSVTTPMLSFFQCFLSSRSDMRNYKTITTLTTLTMLTTLTKLTTLTMLTTMTLLTIMSQCPRWSWEDAWHLHHLVPFNHHGHRNHWDLDDLDHVDQLD